MSSWYAVDMRNDAREKSLSLCIKVGRQNMFLLKRYEQYDTLRKKVTLEINDELKSGEHEFRWSFIVPANTAVCLFHLRLSMSTKSKTFPFPCPLTQ